MRRRECPSAFASSSWPARDTISAPTRKSSRSSGGSAGCWEPSRSSPRARSLDPLDEPPRGAAEKAAMHLADLGRERIDPGDSPGERRRDEMPEHQMVGGDDEERDLF